MWIGREGQQILSLAGSFTSSKITDKIEIYTGLYFIVALVYLHFIGSLWIGGVEYFPCHGISTCLQKLPVKSPVYVAFV